jgi:predicted HicB family RNase H-like nuclease
MSGPGNTSDREDTWRRVYLADCKEEGVHSEEPASGKLLLRVPPEVHGRALVAAKAAASRSNAES